MRRARFLEAERRGEHSRFARRFADELKFPVPRTASKAAARQENWTGQQQRGRKAMKAHETWLTLSRAAEVRIEFGEGKSRTSVQRLKTLKISRSAE